MAQLLAQPATTRAGCWQDLALPYVEDALAPSFETGRQLLGRATFRVDYTVPRDWDPAEALTVYAPRAMGMAWQVRIDGQVVNDTLEDWRMTWNTPVSARLPSTRFQAGQTLQIQIGVAYVPKGGYSMSRITIGPAGVVGRDLALRQYLQGAMPQACSTALLLLGGFFLAFWFLRREESAHLLLACAALAWSVSNLQYILPRHDDPLLEACYSAIVNMAVSWFMWLVYLFVLRFDARRAPWVERLLPAYVLTMSVLAIPMSGLIVDAGLLFQAVNALVAAAVTLLIAARALRGGSKELRVVSAALVLAQLAGAHDVALLAGKVPPESVYLLPYSSLLVFGSLLFALQCRYVHALDAHEVLSASLSLQLAEQEAELNANHQRLIALERSETLANERQRLIHDMHDGLGSTLMTALAMVEQSQLPTDAIARILRAGIDDLRLVIDSLEPVQSDLVGLLAMLRYRLGQQLDAAGLTLCWEVQELPRLDWLQPSDALHVYRIVQEVLANALKHSGASRVRITARALGSCVELGIEDNGCGFDPTQIRPGRGLKSLQRRARHLGGELRIERAAAGGTSMSLRLPLLRA
jgi:signal transduction histidine kinase